MKTFKELSAGDFLTPTIPFIAWNRTKAERDKCYYLGSNNGIYKRAFIPNDQLIFIFN